MPSAIEVYDIKRLAVSDAVEALNALKEQLVAVVEALDDDPYKLLSATAIRFPVEDDPLVAARRRMEESRKLEFLPTSEEVRSAILTLQMAKAEESQAFDALSDVEKQYARPQRERDCQHLRVATQASSSERFKNLWEG